MSAPVGAVAGLDGNQIASGGADNVVGVNYATREFLFDHYLPTDGPTLNKIRQSLRNDTRSRELKKDLGIFGEQ